MSSLQAHGGFVHLDPDEEQSYQQVIDLIRDIKRCNPELGEAFILNALVATGDQDLSQQMEDWSGAVSDIDARERSAFCHGNGPRPDRIVRLRPMEEIASGYSNYLDSE